MKSRAISIILSLVMCATMFPLQVVAETLNEKYTESVSTVSQNSIELQQKSKDFKFHNTSNYEYRFVGKWRRNYTGKC